MTKFTFSKTQFTVLILVLLCSAGLYSYFTLSRAENPLYTVRKARVTTLWPGASPQRVEQLVTDKIEKRIQEIPEVETIESESKTGFSVLTVTVFDEYDDMRPIWDELRRKVEDAERELPKEAVKPIVNDDYGDIFGIITSIVWDGFTYAEVKDIAEDLRDELLEIYEIAKVHIFGTQDERIFIDYNSDKLSEISLSPSQLRDLLLERNIIKSGGIIYGAKEQIAVEPTGNYTSVQDIRDTLIQIPDTENIVRLSDIAQVYRSYVFPPKQMMRTSGKPSLGLAISMRDGSNILELGDRVQNLIKKYEAAYPIGIEFDIVAFEPTRVMSKINDFVLNLIQAIVIVLAVMLIFLGLRLGFIVASLIPVVILITFFLMSAFGIGLNQITLASLIIALGMLVDNAIVMSESILVQMQAGKKAIEAAISSAKELRIALLISSLTTSAAFLPFYLAESGTGEYVGALFVVVTITLLSSWVIALTMIPLFCTIFIRITNKKEEGTQPRISDWYRSTLTALLKHKKLALLGPVGMFVGALALTQFIPKIFYPPSNTPMFTAEVELPVGYSIWRTEDVINHLESYIQKNLVVSEERKEGITNWSTYIGTGGPRFRLQHDPAPPNPFYAYMLFNVTDYTEIPELIRDLDSHLFENFPDVKPKIRPLEEGTPVDNPIEVRISGKDIDALYEMSAKIKEKMGSIPGTKNIDDDWGLKGKKIVVEVDQNRAKRAGITNADIAHSLESALNGVALSDYREDDELIPMLLRSEVASDLNLISTEAFNIYSQNTGKSVPLLQVAKIHVEWEPSVIFRRNRLNTMTIFSGLDEGYNAHAIETQLAHWMESESKSWPPGYRWELGGEEEEAGKAERSIHEKLPIAALLIVLLLMAQFNSFKRLLIIIVTIPLSTIGVIIGLLVTNSYFGVMTLLGMISLAGIVINNAIVLLDRIKIEMSENNLPEPEAVITACQKRLRPICLTTITTAASLFPLWLGGGPLWEPMAIAIIFGLLIATILTLGFVPVFYSVLFNVDYSEK